MIVNWEDEELTYKILTWSHQFADAERLLQLYRTKYPACILMVDANQVKAEQARRDLNELLERMKKQNEQKVSK